MKSIKVTNKNFEKIELEIKIANGKATTRLANIQDVEDYVSINEKALTEKGIPKKYWKGMKFVVQPGAETLPKAYYKKGRPQATEFTLERMTNGWFVISCKRSEFYENHKLMFISGFTEEQKEAIISKAYKF